VTDAPAAICPECGTLGGTQDTYCEACGCALSSAEPLTAEPTAETERASCVACGEDVSPIDDGYCRSCGMSQPRPGDSLEDVQGNGGVAAVTHRGRRRRRNEDAFSIASMPDGRFFGVISDGVSTTVDADLASHQAAVTAVEALGAEHHGDPGKALREAYVAARAAVSRLAESSAGADSAPSCTFLAFTAARYDIHLASMGDCRAFWLPEHGEATTLTEDDSWATEQILAGTMTAEQAHTDNRSHGITRWLGQDADPDWEPRQVGFTAPGPGRLILCSDGLWNYAPSAAAIAGVAGDGSPSAVARRLVDYANRSGGRDNITVVVVAIPCNSEIADPKGLAR